MAIDKQQAMARLYGEALSGKFNPNFGAPNTEDTLWKLLRVASGYHIANDQLPYEPEWLPDVEVVAVPSHQKGVINRVPSLLMTFRRAYFTLGSSVYTRKGMDVRSYILLPEIVSAEEVFSLHDSPSAVDAASQITTRADEFIQFAIENS